MENEPISEENKLPEFQNSPNHLNDEVSEVKQPQDNLHGFDFQSRINLNKLKIGVEKVKTQLAKVVVGQKELIDLLLIGILADGHLLIEGAPGVAKTVTAKLLAKTMAVQFGRIQFTPDLMPSDILGTSIFNLKTNEFEFNKGPVFCQILLIDEINRAPAKTQAALFEVMAERQVTIDGKRFQMEKPFIVFATQNPVEQEGTYRLPEAQLDRFLFKINVKYPSLEEEIQIISAAQNRKTLDPLESIEVVFDKKDIEDLQGIVQEVLIDQNLVDYIAKIVLQTRNHPFLYLGASPRASLGILIASKAYAALQGRDFVIPEDIKYVATPVLNHRIVVSPEKEMEGITSEFIVNTIIESIEIPR